MKYTICKFPVRKTLYTIILCIALVFCTSLCFTQNSVLTDDIRLMTDIRSAEKIGYYPSVIIFANSLLSSFPNSMYTDEALSAKGRALYYTGKAFEAQTVFQKKKQTSLDLYFLGRISYDQKKYAESVRYFYEALNSPSLSSDKEIKASILEYAGKSLYLLGKMEDTVKVYEHLLVSCPEVPVKEETAEILLNAYRKTEKHQKIISLYTQLPLYKFSFNASNRMTLTSGDAYFAVSDYKTAYELYERVLNGASGEDLVIALQKAYVTAEKLGNSDVEALLTSAGSRLADYPQLMSEFWIRLGTARFENGEYDKALESFSKASAPSSADPYAAFYKAAIEMKKNPTDVKNITAELFTTIDKNSVFYFDALIFSTYANAESKNWEDAVYYAAQAHEASPSVKTSFWYGLSLAALQRNSEAAAVLKPYYAENSTDLSFTTLYARTLLATGQEKEALSIFEQISLDTASMESKENYALSLIIADKSELVSSVISPFDSSLTSYLCALAAFLQKQWMESESLFVAYLRTKPDEKLQPYARYYAAYSQYMQGKYAAAFDSFTAYEKDPKAITLLWNSYYYSALSAVNEYQSSQKSQWMEKAEDKAKLSYERSRTDTEKQQSLLLYADILGGRKKYDEALSLLAPYTIVQDGFTVYALFYSADLYTNKGDVKNASSMYERLLQNFPVHPLAEQALFASGELYYKNSQWQDAIERFTQYKRSYPKGLFITAALHYGAESCIQDKNEGQAILSYLEMLKNYPDNSYEASALFNLVKLYRNKREYFSALETAQLIQKKYPDLAKKNALERQMEELAILISGEDEKIAVALASFTANGQEKTKEGRLAGFTLGELYMASPLLRTDGSAVLKKMLASYDASSAEEKSKAASAHFLLGSYYREILNYSEASTQFLKSAELNASYDAEKSAQSLYCAIESFDCSGLYADARSVYTLLSSKYAQSKWVSRAAVLLRGIPQ